MLINTLFLFLLPIIALAFPSTSILNSVSEVKCGDALEACNNIRSAQSCKSVQPCIHIWEKLKAPEDNNEICDLCKDMVKQARDQLLSNETQEEIKEVFEGSCNLIPIKALAAECRNVVDQLIPTLIETLASRMDPTMVCTVAGLCNNGQLSSIMKRQLDASELAPFLVKTAIKSDKCSECESAMTFVKKIIKHIGLDSLTQLSFQACQDDFQGSTAQCARLIVGVLPVFGNISEADETNICAILRRCPDSKPESDRGCLLCTGFVGAASQLPQLPSALIAVEDYFLDHCILVESDRLHQEKCQATVKSTLQVIQKYLWTKDDPSFECKNAGLCSPSKWNFVQEIMKDRSENSEVCTICQEIFQFLRDKFMTLKVKEEIHKDLDDLCLKAGQLGPTCQSFVDQYFNVIYDALVEDLTPDVMCDALKLCSSQKGGSLKRSIEEGLDRFCKTQLYITEVQCEVIVRDVIPVVFNYLKVMDPPVFCGAMQSCPVKYPLVKSVGDELTCEFCETLVQYVRNTFTSATTKEEFRTAFTNMCKDLRKFSSECSSLVNEYFDQFYDFIVGQMDPKLVCSALGLCDNALPVTKMVKLIPAKVNPQIDIYPALAVLKQVNRVGLRIVDTKPQQEESRPGIQIHLPMFSQKTNHFQTKENMDTNRIDVDDTLPAREDTDTNRIDVDETFNPQLQQLPVERYFYPSIIAKSDMTCTLCKTIINFLDKELQDQKTEEAIRQALDKVCSYLPKELGAQCVDFVNEYTEMIVTLLLQEFTPDAICNLLKVCLADDNTFKAIPIQPNGVFCEVCVKVMQYVEKELESNTTEEAIKEALDKACSYLPKSYAAKCQSFMDQYAEMIFELLSKEIAPRAVCTMLGICPFAPKNNGDLDCQICQYTLHYIQGLLMNNATIEEIKEGLEKACDELPQKIASECKNYIEQYGASILALLAQEIDPSVICVKLNICPGRQNKMIQSTNYVQSLKIDTCGTCQVVVDYMDKLLENDDVDREITKLVEKVCTIVPASTREQCTGMIELYGPYILQMIGQLADSKEVCQTIDLCARVPGHVHLLGGGKCSFGPSYWCKSSAHAAACKAQLYCKQNVWEQ